jgi:GMP synthase (glutamine-hydrolysing)
MHIHYFQHDHFEDLGFIGDWAAGHNFTTSVTRFDMKAEIPAHEDYDWLVVLGGKMSVNDSEKFPWLKAEIEFIKDAIDKGKIVIGICLGSQLVAKACGSDVFRNTEPELGFWPVTFLETAKNDSVFRHFRNDMTVLHVHFDTFSLPERAVSMANSAVTPCQAFRLGKNVFAFQFHFEVTPQNVAGFIREIEPELVEGKYSQTAEQMLERTDCCSQNNLVFDKVLDEILALTDISINP